MSSGKGGTPPGGFQSASGSSVPTTWAGSASGQTASKLLQRGQPGYYTQTFNEMFGRPQQQGPQAPQGSFYEAFNNLFRPQQGQAPFPGMPLPGQPVPPYQQMPGQQQPGPGPQQPGGGGTPNPKMPSWGGWAWGGAPIDSIVKAGFDWFEVGYPTDYSSAQYAQLRNNGVTPFAYINLGELDPNLAGVANYNGPILRQNGDWGTKLVDVTNQSWQDWLIRRAGEAYSRGARGIKWDVATPDVPQGKSRADVNRAIANVMGRLRSTYPDMKFVFNQGFDFAKAYPQYVDGIQTEGLFSAASYPKAYLKPWEDPWYWGPQFQDMKSLHQQYGIPMFVAEYTDPWSSRAKELYNAITAQGFVPYITDERWQQRGYGYNINPGW